MEISFPINKLIKENLTPDEFSICMLLDEDKPGLLRELAKLKGDSFYKDIQHLNELGYLQYNTIGNIVQIKDLTLTEEFKKLIAFGDPFLELYNTFPVRAIRPGGEVDYLRRNKVKCNIKYNKIIKNNPLLHRHILSCLSAEKREKQQKNTLGYFKRLINWLETREWEKYEDKIDNFEDNATTTQQTESVAYGDRFI